MSIGCRFGSRRLFGAAEIEEDDLLGVTPDRSNRGFGLTVWEAALVFPSASRLAGGPLPPLTSASTSAGTQKAVRPELKTSLSSYRQRIENSFESPWVVANSRPQCPSSFADNIDVDDARTLDSSDLEK